LLEIVIFGLFLAEKTQNDYTPMKNRYLPIIAAFVAMFLLPLMSVAQTTVTPLLSESFTQGESFPPSGWSCSYLGEYNAPYGGWYESGGGNGGYGGSYGSAVCAPEYMYQPGCYTGYNDGKLYMYAPAISTGSVPETDSLFLDFDLWFPEGYYQIYVSPYQEDQVEVYAGSTQLLDQKSPGNCNFATYSYFSDPSEYDESQYWEHFHVYVPNGGSSTSLTFEVADNGGYCYYGYEYCENVAFTNVVVTDVHHPILTVNGPTTINFGTVPVGLQAGPYYTKLSNSNTGPIALGTYGLAGADPQDFTITRAPASIPAGGKDSIGILYSPKLPGARSAYLQFSSNAIPSTLQDTLIGQGVTPDVSYSSTSMFRGVDVELTHTSATQYLYVNSIGGIPLTLGTVSFYGLNANNYTITHLPAGPIAVGSVDSIGVQFTPGIEGLPDAHMVVNSNAFNNPSDTVTMDGVGILPHLAIDSAKSWPLPTTVNFDSVKLGSTSSITVQFWNPGSDTVAIEKNFFENHDPDFTFAALSGTDTLIPPGGYENITINFTPVQQGTRVATIRIFTDIPHTETTPPQDTSEFIINVVGNGVPTGKLAITGPTNGNVLVGKSSTVTDTFWNTGDAAITVSTVSIAGTNAADFTASYPTLPFTIAPNSNQLFTVTATPSDTGAETATFTSTGTENEAATLALAVYGQAISDTAIVTQSFLAESCGSDTEVITVTNTGNVPVTYTASIEINPNFTVTPASSSVVPAGGTATFTVVFTETTAGAATPQFLNITNSGTETSQSIPLTANGGAATISGTQQAPVTSIGNTSAQFTVTVNNTGSCSWTSGVPTVDPQFTYVSGAATIAPAGSAPFVFTYTPTVAGGPTYPVTFNGATGLTTAAPNVTITTALDAVDPVAVSNGFSLDQNYPNPFSGTSNVEITLPVGCLVHLAIINVEGQVVQTVLNQHYDAGSFEITLDATGLASGTYYYQMTAGDVTLTRQMVVVK
jgi:hypothetical protein